MSGSESTKAPESYHPSLGIHRNLACNILKYLEDDIVRDKEISSLDHCSECFDEILTLPPKAFTMLTCGHLFHRLCIEKKLLLTVPNTCPFPDCGKNVDILEQADDNGIVSNTQDSPLSRISDLMRERFILSSPIIQMTEAVNTGLQQAKSHLRCAKCSEDLSSCLPPIDFLRFSAQPQGPSKPLVYLTCKHIVHYNCIDNSCRLCPICDLGTPSEPSTAQKKRSRGSGASTEKSSRKKAKKTGVSDMLEKFIEELSYETSQVQEVMEEGVGSFFDLYNAIVKMEEQAEIANRDVIKSYFNFGKALTKRFDYYMNANPKRTSQVLVNEEVREQLPISVSDDSLRKRKEKALKIYELFSEIGEHMIQRIKSFSASAISKFSQDDINKILIRFASV